MKPIVLELTVEQQAAVEPFMDRLRKMAEQGKAGICAAQVFPDHIRIGILSHDKAKEAVEAAGGDSSVRIRVAPERLTP